MWTTSWLEICYFYISQIKLSLDKIFYNVVYHHIIYICDFLVNLDDFFTMVCTSFYKYYGFHYIHPLYTQLFIHSLAPKTQTCSPMWWIREQWQRPPY